MKKTAYLLMVAGGFAFVVILAACTNPTSSSAISKAPSGSPESPGSPEDAWTRTNYLQGYAGIPANGEMTDYMVYYDGMVSGSNGQRLLQLYGLEWEHGQIGQSVGEYSDSTTGMIQYDRRRITVADVGNDIPSAYDWRGNPPEPRFIWSSSGSRDNRRYYGFAGTFFPPVEQPSRPFRELRKISVEIHQKLLTGNLRGGFAGGGISLGFGEPGATHAEREHFQSRFQSQTDTVVRLGIRIVGI